MVLQIEMQQHTVVIKVATSENCHTKGWNISITGPLLQALAAGVRSASVWLKLTIGCNSFYLV